MNEKYGKDYLFQTDFFKNKSHATILEKYGVEHLSENVSFQENNLRKGSNRISALNRKWKEKIENSLNVVVEL